MTTIAYRDKILASDSRVTIKDYIDGDNEKKIWRLRDGSLFGTSGDVSGGYRLLEMLKQQLKSKKLVLPSYYIKGTKAIFVTPKGKIFYYEGGFWEERKKGSYLAIGSGGKFARVAMDFGASAQEAVKAGISCDIYSGGKVRWLKLGG